jgi:hypothetical protein
VKRVKLNEEEGVRVEKAVEKKASVSLKFANAS